MASTAGQAWLAERGPADVRLTVSGGVGCAQQNKCLVSARVLFAKQTFAQQTGSPLAGHR